MFVHLGKKIDDSDGGRGIHGQRWTKGGRKVRESVEHRLSKVQSSGHGAGHYMGFWGYGGGNRLPWDRSFSSFLSFLFFSPFSLSLFLCFPFPSPSFASSTLSSLFLSFSFLASLPQVFRTDAKIYTWRLVRRCTLV